ncbi:MAG TPA: hypothetical protein PLY21_06320, partial [Spirochaetota bacterium]|nr:hypothetical protein [Spirochaetota bacterium]
MMKIKSLFFVKNVLLSAVYAAVALNFLFFCGCGGGGGNSATATTAGGTFTFPGGITLEMEPGSLDRDTEITLAPLTATDVEDAVNSSTLVDSQFFGGFSGTPEGLVFNKPVKISIQIEDVTDPGTILLHGIISAGNTLTLTDTDIIADTANNRVTFEVEGFSQHFTVKAKGQEWLATFDPTKEWDKCRNWNGRDAEGNPLGTETVEDDCRCGRRRYTTQHLDYVNSEGCQSVQTIINVEFLDCETPTYWIHVMSEETGCNRKYAFDSSGIGSQCDDYGNNWSIICPWPLHWEDMSCKKSSGFYAHTVIWKYKVDYNCGQLLETPLSKWTYMLYDDAQYEAVKDYL